MQGRHHSSPHKECTPSGCRATHSSERYTNIALHSCPFTRSCNFFVMALARSSRQAAASSSQPLPQSSSTTSHNKEFSVLSDEHLFSKFVDAETFDFSDSSYDRSTSVDISDRDSWFDEPFTSTSNGLVGLPTGKPSCSAMTKSLGPDSMARCTGSLAKAMYRNSNTTQ